MLNKVSSRRKSIRSTESSRPAQRVREKTVLWFSAMSEVSVAELRQAVESQHGGTATLVQSVPVREIFERQTLWQGVVHIFDLADHPKANRAYVWSSECEDAKRRFYAVLHMGPVTGPVEAVRAAIVAERRGGP